ACVASQQRQPRSSLLDPIRGNESIDGAPALFEIESRWNASPFGVSHQAFPVMIESERLAAIDAQRREHAPAVEQSRVGRSYTGGRGVYKLFVVEDETMHTLRR